MKISLKRFYLTLIAILAVSVSFDLIGGELFDNSLVFKAISKMALILGVFYIIKQEKFLNNDNKGRYGMAYLMF